jgi:hypothetical protein
MIFTIILHIGIYIATTTSDDQIHMIKILVYLHLFFESYNIKSKSHDTFHVMISTSIIIDSKLQIIILFIYNLWGEYLLWGSNLQL